MNTRSLQSSIDLSREACVLMNEAWCSSSAYGRAVSLADAEQRLCEALREIRKVRTPIRDKADA